MDVKQHIETCMSCLPAFRLGLSKQVDIYVPCILHDNHVSHVSDTHLCTPQVPEVVVHINQRRVHPQGLQDKTTQHRHQSSQTVSKVTPP